MHPQRWRVLGDLVGSFDRFWCTTFRRVAFLRTGHFFTFREFHFEIHFWWLFSHFCWLFKHFSLTFVHLSWTFHRFYCLFCQQRTQVEAFFVGWLLFKNKCFSFINHKLALTKLGGSTFFAPWTIIAGYKCRKGKYWEF